MLFGRLIDRFGPRTTVVPALLTVASIVMLAGGRLSPLLLAATAVMAMACAAATHQSLNGIVGGFYPTIIRGNGVGYATGMGRMSAIIGPVIAGWLMAANTPLQQTLWAIAAPELVVAAAAIGLDIVRRSPSAAADFAISVPAEHGRTGDMSSRIPRLEMEQLAPEVQQTLAARVKRLGYLGEFFKCSGHNPAVLVSFMEMTEALKACAAGPADRSGFADGRRR